MDNYKHIDKKVVFENEHFRIFQEKLLLPEGKEVWWSFIEGIDSVGVLAINNEGKIVLVKQYRPAIQGFTVEIPAGLTEEGETPEETAFRELEEETGYRAGRLKKIFEYYSSPGISKSKVHLFLAEELEKTQQCLDEHEFLEVIEAPQNDMKKFDFIDGKSILALKYLENYSK